MPRSIGSLPWRLPAVFGPSLMVLALLGCGAGSDTVPEDMQDYHGSFDICDTSVISGWAWDPDEKAQVKVDIYVIDKEKDKDGKEKDKDRLLVTIPANKYRVDLKYKDRKWGFAYKTPAELKKPTADGNPHQIKVKIHGLEIELDGSPKPLKQS